MMTIKQQIQQAKKTRTEQIKDIWYTDDCNNCKDLEIRGSNYLSCTHQWYCHHDNGPVQELEFKIGLINHNINQRGYMCSYEREELKKLRDIKFELVKECRRSLPPIKH